MRVFSSLYDELKLELWLVKALKVVAEEADQEDGPDDDDGEEEDAKPGVDLVNHNVETPIDIEEEDAIMRHLKIRLDHVPNPHIVKQFQLEELAENVATAHLHGDDLDHHVKQNGKDEQT